MGHKERGKDFEGRTYLLIRDHILDDGSEPLPASLTACHSPDIVVVKPDGTRGGEAVAERENHVEVTVTNLGGMDANSLVVDRV